MSTETLIEPKSTTRTCPMYKVIMHNDDVTTMQFVVEILCNIFGKNPMNAMQVMLEIHLKGQGLAGVYALEQAEFRVDQCHSLARARKFPLTCTIEPA